MADKKKASVRDDIEKALDSDSDEARSKRGQISKEQSDYLENAMVAVVSGLAGRSAMRKVYDKVVKPTHSFKTQGRIGGSAANVAGLGAGMVGSGVHYSMTEADRKKRRK